MAKDLRLKLVIEGESADAKADIAAIKKALDGVGDEATRTGARSKAGMQEASAGFKSVSGHISTAKAQLVGFLAGVGVVRMAGEVLGLAETFDSLNAQLRVSTRDHGNLAAMQDEVFRIAQDTGAQLDATGKTYARLTNAIEDMGGSHREAAIVTETLNNALKINKATTAEASSAQLQFSQAIGSGVLRGEEFNAVNEAAAPLMIALAKELGVTRGELRGMAEDGQLTNQLLIPAITEIHDTLKQQGEEMGFTLGQMWNKVTTSAIKSIGEMGAATTALNGIKSALGALADNFDVLIQSAGVLATVLLGIGVSKLIPILATAAGGMATASAGMLSMAGAAGVLKGALALLGGPIGLLITGLGSLAMYAANANAEIKRLNSTKIQATDIAGKQLTQLNLQLREVKERMEDVRKSVGESSPEYQTLAEKASGIETAMDAVREAYVKSREEGEEVTDGLVDMSSETQKLVDKLKGQYLPQLTKEQEYLKKVTALQAAASRGDKDAVTAMQELAAEYQRGGVSIEEYRDELSKKREELQKVVDKYSPLDVAQKKYREELTSLKRALDTNLISESNYQRALELAGAEYTKAVYTATDYETQLKALEAQEKKNKKAADDHAQAYSTLRDELYPVEALTRTYHEQVGVLTQELGSNGEMTDELRDALEKLGVKQTEQIDQLSGMAEGNKDVAIAAEESAGQYSEVWKSAFNRLDGIAQQGWRDMIDGTKSVGEALKDWFKDLLAELAHTALTKPIVLSITSALTGGGSSGVGGIGSSLLGDAFGGAASTAAGYAGTYAGSMMAGAGSQQAAMLAAQTAEFGAAGTTATTSALGGVTASGAASVVLPAAVILGALDMANAQDGFKGTFQKGDWENDGRSTSLSSTGQSVVGFTTDHSSRDGGIFHSNDDRAIQNDLSAAYDEAINQSLSGYYDVVQQIGEALRPGEDIQGILDNVDSRLYIAAGTSAEDAAVRTEEWLAQTGAMMLDAIMPGLELKRDIEDSLAGVFEAIGMSSNVFDAEKFKAMLVPFAQVAEYVSYEWQPSVTQSLKQADEASKQATLEIIAQHDGSVVTTQAIGTAMMSRLALEQSMYETIAGVEASINATTDSLRERMLRMTETDQEFVIRLNAEIGSAIAELRIADDATEINGLMGEITSNISEVLGASSGEAQAQTVASMDALLTTAEGISQTRLDEMRTGIEAGHEVISDAAINTLTSGKDLTRDAAQYTADAAADMSSAAVNINGAANDLKVVAVSLNNSAGSIISANERDYQDRYNGA